jgi:hypothetical protein
MDIRSESILHSHNEGGADPNHMQQVDNVGQAILKLLDQAAGAAEANSRRALETAQTLSKQLRAAEDRLFQWYWKRSCLAAALIWWI